MTVRRRALGAWIAAIAVLLAPGIASAQESARSPAPIVALARDQAPIVALARNDAGNRQILVVPKPDVLTDEKGAAEIVPEGGPIVRAGPVRINAAPTLILFPGVADSRQSNGAVLLGLSFRLPWSRP